MYKFLAFALIITIVLIAFISCATPTNEEPVNKPDSEIENEQIPANGDINKNTNKKEERVDPELPETDFDGYTFTFLTHMQTVDTDWVNDIPMEILSESETGEPINDAVYKRNDIITDRYNFNIGFVPFADEKAALKKSVQAGEDIYDAVIIFNNNVPGVITGGMLIQTNQLPYIDQSKPWWDPAVKSIGIDNKNFLFGGDLLILDNEATNVLLFNKNLFADYDMPLPYNLVKDGKWTFDALNELVVQVSEDLNGDGIMSGHDDRFGLLVYKDTLHAFLVGGGGALAIKDKNDIPYMTVANEHSLRVSEKAMEIMYNENFVVNCQVHGVNYIFSFEERRALFLWARMRAVESFRNMEDEFGILPMPKIDETQERYYSLVNPYTGAMLGVPKTIGDPERTSLILEALCAESRYTLQPAYYDVVLTRKYTRDEESNDMLDIIFNSRVYDIGAVYSFGNVFIDYIELTLTQNRNVMSYYDKNAEKMQKAIDKTVDLFRSFD